MQRRKTAPLPHGIKEEKEKKCNLIHDKLHFGFYGEWGATTNVQEIKLSVLYVAAGRHRFAIGSIYAKF